MTACIAATAMTMASVVTTSATSWKQDGKGWWFENTDGTYVSNAWKQINGKWYAFDNQGYMRTGWFQENGIWYYLDNSGAMRTGWVKENEKWYYLDRSGAMQTGWIKENGKWYYLAADGACFINARTPDGYMVDANGVWIDSSFFLDNYDRYEDSDEDEDSDTYEEPTESQEEESTTDREEPTTSQEEESTTDREEPTTSQEEESTTDREEPTTSQEEESTTDREELTTSQEEESTTEEESKKPSLEEVVEAYKAFIWYDFVNVGEQNYIFIDLNDDDIPECVRRPYAKDNSIGIGVGILTYSEEAENHVSGLMPGDDMRTPLYYVKGGNVLCNYLSDDGRYRIFNKINDKGEFEYIGMTELGDSYWINGTKVSKEEYDNYINSFGEFTEVSLKYEDTYRSIDAAYEAYLSKIKEEITTKPEEESTAEEETTTKSEEESTTEEETTTKLEETTTETELSELEVYKAIMNMQSEYPEGMEWTNDNSYSWNGGIYSGGHGCAGFAFLLSDAAFGDLPARKYTQYDPSTIKVGDIIRIDNDGHSVIVLTVDEEGVTVAEGNYNRSIHWGRSITHEQLMDADYIITRYQES